MTRAEFDEDSKETTGEAKRARSPLEIQERMVSLAVLTAGIAHEVRNPLNFVNSFARLTLDTLDELHDALVAQRDTLDPEVLDSLIAYYQQIRDNTATIRKHGERAADVVTSILALARGEDRERQAVDLNRLLVEFARMTWEGLREQYQEVDVAVEERLDPAVGRLEIVPQEISRVVINLVSNAVVALSEKRARQGASFRPTIRICTRDLGDAVEIRIEDNGNGISAALSDNLFQPFVSTRSTDRGNVGLGLSICHDIVVQQHHGRIEAVSEPGEYTHMVITLPRQRT